MKLRVAVSLLGVLALFGGVARAQERQTVEVFAGYSYLRANPSTSGSDSFSLNGGSASIAYNVNNWLSGVADLGGKQKRARPKRSVALQTLYLDVARMM